jgi:hypothetical protein
LEFFFANYFFSFFTLGDFIFATCKECFLFLRIAKSLNVSNYLFVPDFFYLTPFFQRFIQERRFSGKLHPGWHIHCNSAGGMNLRDLLIIYLACGAPFGVYYYLQNRNRTETKFLWLKSLLRFVVWIPFALQMVARTSLLTNLYNNGFDKSSESDAKRELEIEEIKKYFENIFSPETLSFSIYEFREIFDRYVGLSLEVQAENDEISPAESEIFRITNHGNKKLAEICLNRRNRKRFTFHQKLARRDFFEILHKFVEKSAEPQNIFAHSAKLTALLKDFEAQKIIENLSKESLQTIAQQNVRITGEELWKSDKHKPLTDNKISTNLQVLTATANLSNKD